MIDTHCATTGYYKTTRREITRRGVMWLGQTCNLRCFFCYFHSRIKDAKHPQHPFMSIEKAKAMCKTLVDVYGNTAIDIQGGEPTIYKDIYELISYCREIGLEPTLITNAIVLDDLDRCQALKDAGVRDLLISVQGLGDVYDLNVGVPGASKRQMKAIDYIRQVGIPFRLNSVLNNNTLPQLEEIARLAIEKGARVVNFIAFNPFEDQILAGIRNDESVPRYTDAAPYIHNAVDMLKNAGIEVNIRYYPFCVIDEKHRDSLFNFQQMVYDPHEWDWASFAWTGLDPQRTKLVPLSPVVTLEQHTREMLNLSQPVYNGKLKLLVQRSLKRFPRVYNLAERIYGKTNFLFERKPSVKSTPDQNLSVDEAYRLNGRLRAEKHCRYQYAEACRSCSLKQICDGFHGDYASMFGTSEAKPVVNIPKINDPRYYINAQEKVVEIY